MKPLRTFRLEEYLGEWEFKVRYHLTASDAESITIEELLALGTDADREGFMKLPLSYIETWGTPELRAAVAETYEHVDADHVLAFAGAEEALFWAMQELVGPGDHAVVTVPCYQAMETVTVATGADVSALVPRREDGWALDLDELRSLLRPTTKLVAVNYPNNPTGLRSRRGDLPRARGAVRRARHPPVLRRGLPRHRGRPGQDDHPGGRSVGDGRLAQRGLQVLRPSGPARRLARLPRPRRCSSASRSASTTRRSATRGRRSTSPRSRSAIASPSGRATAASSPPTGRSSTTSSPAGRSSSTGSRRWAAASASPATRAATSRSFCARLLDAEGVLVLPASMYYSEIAAVPTDHFRVGIGRLGLEEGLEAFDRFLRAQN